MCIRDRYTTEDLKKYITITSSKDSSVELYKDGALPEAGKKILGVEANVTINLAKGSVIPVSYTHLDVYKRQLFSAAPKVLRKLIGNISWHCAISIISWNYWEGFWD